jgi:hypothetical protein
MGGDVRENQSRKGVTVGIDDMVKTEISEITPEIKNRLVSAFDALTHEDLKDAGSDPNELVDRISEKTGQSRDEVDAQVKQIAQQQGVQQPPASQQQGVPQQQGEQQEAAQPS